VPLVTRVLLVQTSMSATMQQFAVRTECVPTLREVTIALVPLVTRVLLVQTLMNAQRIILVVPILSAITLLATTLALASLDSKEMRISQQDAQTSMSAPMRLFAVQVEHVTTSREVTIALVSQVTRVHLAQISMSVQQVLHVLPMPSAPTHRAISLVPAPQVTLEMVTQLLV